MKHNTISILGACGAAGEVVARILAEHTSNTVILADIDVNKVRNLADQLRNGIEPIRMDVYDEARLRDLCRRSDVVVNCVGPTFKIKGLVGMVAIQEQCDYIEIGGYDYTTEEMRKKIHEKSSLSYIISAGWGPGISDLLAYYSDMRANELFDEKTQLRLFFGDRGWWSDIGLWDIVMLTKTNGTYPMHIFKNGKLKKVFNSFRRIDLPFGLNREKACVNMIPELEMFARQHGDYHEIKGYGILFDWKTYFTYVLIGFFLRSKDTCVRLLKKAFKREVDTKGERGIALVEVQGTKGGKGMSLWTKIDARGGYYMTGAGCAATVLCLLKQKVRKGVGFMSASVDVKEYVATLKKIGIEIQEMIE